MENRPSGLSRLWMTAYDLDSSMAMEVWSPGPPRLWLVDVEVMELPSCVLSSMAMEAVGVDLHGTQPTASMEDHRGSFFFFWKKKYMCGAWLYSYDFCHLFDEKVDRSLAFTLRPNTGLKSIKLETGVLMSKSPKAHRGLLLIFL